MDVAIELSGAAKSYGERFGPAVAGLSLAVEAGEILGLVGPNGAGKTTTVLMLAGLLQPSAGSVRVLGKQVRPGRGNPRVGLVCGSLEDFDYLTGAESVLLAGRMLGLTGAEADRRAQVLLTAFDIGGGENRLTTTCSSGMKQKIRIACALVGSPAVLLLDEPFEALDAAACEILSAIVRRFASDGGAVLLCSHDLRLVQRLATHYAILHAGRLQEHGRMDALGTVSGPPTDSKLEQRLWALTGAPAAPHLDWLRPATGQAEQTMSEPLDRACR